MNGEKPIEIYLGRLARSLREIEALLESWKQKLNEIIFDGGMNTSRAHR